MTQCNHLDHSWPMHIPRCHAPPANFAFALLLRHCRLKSAKGSVNILHRMNHLLSNCVIILRGADVFLVVSVANKKKFSLRTEQNIIIWISALDVISLAIGIHAEAGFKYVSVTI